MPDTIYAEAKILIVDDEVSNVVLLETILKQGGYQIVRSTTDSCEALPLFEDFQPDILLLDLNMPEMDGFQVMEHLAPLIQDENIFPFWS